jgi:hypothetical protein
VELRRSDTHWDTELVIPLLQILTADFRPHSRE